MSDALAFVIAAATHSNTGRRHDAPAAVAHGYRRRVTALLKTLARHACQRPLPMSPRELSEAPPWPRANVTGGRVPRREGVWADRGAIDTPSAAVTKADRQPTALRDIGVVT